MKQNLTAEMVAALAVESMLYEVSATPKPGLVDRANNGAHYDMDFFTFMSSAAGLHKCFDELIQDGIWMAEHPVPELLPVLRETGIQAEKQMFQFTKGVNTHKGMIFSLGMLCGCWGWLYEKNDQELTAEHLCETVAVMCQSLCQRELEHLQEQQLLTKGEQMYLKYGSTGVRGVVESGYEVVRTHALPIYRIVKKSGLSQNDALVHTLLYLIREMEDTNILSRHDRKTAEHAKAYAAKVIACGGMFSKEGRQCVMDMDQDFIERYISPGGCADMLAVTHFLYSLEEAAV